MTSIKKRKTEISFPESQLKMGGGVTRVVGTNHWEESVAKVPGVEQMNAVLNFFTIHYVFKLRILTLFAPEKLI